MGGVRKARTARGASTLESAVGYTTGQLATQPAEMRARLADVNPLQTDVLTAKQTGQTLETLATLGEVGEAREGTIQEVIGAGTNRLLSLADLKRAESDRASAEADALSEMLNYQEAVKNREFDERIAQQKFDLEVRKENRLGQRTPTSGDKLATAATADATAGLSSEDFARRYAGQMETWELIQIYNQNSPYQAMSQEEERKYFPGWVKEELKGESEGSSTQWEEKQRVLKEAYAAQKAGRSDEAIEEYIRSEGFDPYDIGYY